MGGTYNDDLMDIVTDAGKFSGEEFSGDPTEIEPQHLSPNDSMVFYQQLETCAPELIDDATEIAVKASWQDVQTFESVEVSQTFTVAQLLAAEASKMAKGAAILAYTDALIQIKKGDPTLVQATTDAAYAALAVAEAALLGDPALVEIHAILDALTQ